MSALNVTQDEADLLLVGLNMYADVQRNASGSVPEDVKALMAKLMPAPVAAPVVEAVVEPVVEAEQPENEPTHEEVEAHFAAEEAAKTQDEQE
jgi:hypothetical protein